MKPVSRGELLDLAGYEEIRERFRARIIEEKRHRRLAVGEHMTFIWENHDTMLYQVQEMLRTERITSESAIAHELETYNTLVPKAGQLSSTLMIEYTDPAERRVMLDKLASLRQEVALHVGERVITGVFHDQPGEELDRLPAVNYVTFEVGNIDKQLDDAAIEVRLEIKNASYATSATMPMPMRKQLAADLREP
jgi:hypothetical protein